MIKAFSANPEIKTQRWCKFLGQLKKIGKSLYAAWNGARPILLNQRSQGAACPNAIKHCPKCHQACYSPDLITVWGSGSPTVLYDTFASGPQNGHCFFPPPAASVAPLSGPSLQRKAWTAVKPVGNKGREASLAASTRGCCYVTGRGNRN